MLFSSYDFIFIFLPFVLIFSSFLSKNKNLFIVFLIFSSFLFYLYGLPHYIFLLTSLLIFNYLVSKFLNLFQDTFNRKLLLYFSIILNISVLFYYKYSNFFIQNFNYIYDDFFRLNHDLILPLGISFFTFQQIGYLIDIYYKKHQTLSLTKYFFFVSFFPQLIVGPIMKCSHFIKQIKNIKISKQLITIGLTIFVIGLSKKLIIADRFAPIANYYFGSINDINFNPGLIDSWIASLSYTFQLYFDFSGYMDMAMGIALCFNIVLPLNFYSPYKSHNIVEFWRRWHISLGQFFRDYIYIPLGGNKNLPIKNLLITMFLVGLWHGAGWTFIIWGLGHGLALIIDRKLKRKNNFHNIIITFSIVSLLWVMFRSNNFSDALIFYSNLFNLTGNNFISENLYNDLLYGRIENLVIFGLNFIFGNKVSKIIFWMGLLFFSFAFVLFFPNTISIFKNQIKVDFSNYRFAECSPITEKIRFKYSNQRTFTFMICILFLICFVLLKRQVEFLYFQF